MPRDCDPKHLRCTWRLEAEARRRGWSRVAGSDEAGRGALLGPLYAAAVILDAARPIRGLDDSKKLAPAERERLAAEIHERAIAWRVVEVAAREVDALNIYEASRQAMLRALAGLEPQPEFVLTDAMPLAPRSRFGVRGSEFGVPNPALRTPHSEVLKLPYRAIIHGDARSVSIAAASILAKVARDARLVELDLQYPQYGLARNKGYGTAEHLEALRRFGPCPEHRKTYQPVRQLTDRLLPLFPIGSA